MKIGDEVFVHGYVDEIRKDVVIIRNDGGYFGTIEDEIISVEIKALYKGEAKPYCLIMDGRYKAHCINCAEKGSYKCTKCDGEMYYTADTPQTDLVKESPSLVKDLVNAFCEDGTWLERQGVYTLTLAEAKQRAVDIIEAVSRKDTADTPQMEVYDYKGNGKWERSE